MRFCFSWDSNPPKLQCPKNDGVIKACGFLRRVSKCQFSVAIDGYYNNRHMGLPVGCVIKRNELVEMRPSLIAIHK